MAWVPHLGCHRAAIQVRLGSHPRLDWGRVCFQTHVVVVARIQPRTQRRCALSDRGARVLAGCHPGGHSWLLGAWAIQGNSRHGCLLRRSPRGQVSFLDSTTILRSIITPSCPVTGPAHTQGEGTTPAGHEHGSRGSWPLRIRPPQCHTAVTGSHFPDVGTQDERHRPMRALPEASAALCAHIRL